MNIWESLGYNLPIFSLRKRLLRALALASASGDDPKKMGNASLFVLSQLKRKSKARDILFWGPSRLLEDRNRKIVQEAFDQILDELINKLETLLAKGSYGVLNKNIGSMEERTNKCIQELNRMARSDYFKTSVEDENRMLRIIRMKTNLSRCSGIEYSETVHSDYSAYCSPDACNDSETSIVNEVRFPPDLDFSNRSRDRFPKPFLPKRRNRIFKNNQNEGG